ncbi:conserved hypothetical protein [Ancylobacter novellus DSM 506]|uniref:DUF4258 domain-containing protein n=1 Tax=Ancylobacter novellus (strain ATCC 8093 / DSM 506 / JCM 20403 / CCM 1077 / IAM 12100 / NBRC 12443 / NCIMB 10456) TaxID=639283 RepID=D7A5D8_ANCN5|nr:DUF4258 domain-containing protein [Ancylobacter novellus]ADH88062.1 conserved hypothetical protein [Ancylobacter novellus DSM 506]
MPNHRFSAHMQVVLRERGLDIAWVKRVLASPEWVEPDPNDPQLTRAFASVPERGGRILRVVYRDDGATRFVVTAFFDRGARRP